MVDSTVNLTGEKPISQTKGWVRYWFFQRNLLSNSPVRKLMIGSKSTHEWPRVRFNQNISVLLLWRHKERDKKQFKEILPSINYQHLVLVANLLHKLEKNTTRKRLSIHKNVFKAVSQSELNSLWRGTGGGRGAVKIWASGINCGGGGG